jgi:hypothetical protein
VSASTEADEKEVTLFAPLRDGVFRVVPPETLPDGGAQDAARQPKIARTCGCWTAIVDVSGEVYQAFFDTEEAAALAARAACGQ